VVEANIDTNVTDIKLYPTLIDRGAQLTLIGNGYQMVTPYLSDINGKLISQYPTQSLLSTGVFLKAPDNIAAGLYFLSVNGNLISKTFKILIK
jgi:hypothetical protein